MYTCKNISYYEYSTVISLLYILILYWYGFSFLATPNVIGIFIISTILYILGFCLSKMKLKNKISIMGWIMVIYSFFAILFIIYSFAPSIYAPRPNNRLLIQRAFIFDINIVIAIYIYCIFLFMIYKMMEHIYISLFIISLYIIWIVYSIGEFL